MKIGTGGKENKVVATFGTGNIRMTAGVLNESMILGFKHEDRSRNIGKKEPCDYESVTELSKDSDILFVFDKEESIDVLIGKLQELKELKELNNEEDDLFKRIEKIEVTVSDNYTADISEEEKKAAEFEDTLNNY